MIYFTHKPVLLAFLTHHRFYYIQELDENICKNCVRTEDITMFHGAYSQRLTIIVNFDFCRSLTTGLSF